MLTVGIPSAVKDLSLSNVALACLLLIPLILLALLTAILLPLTLYNLLLHPLRSFPGPLLHRALPLPHFLSTLLGTTHTSMSTLHTLYGPVVRISPNQLSYISASSWHSIYGVRGASPSHPQMLKEELEFPGEEFEFFAPAKPMISCNAGEHARQRRVVGLAFSERAVRGYEEVVGGMAGVLMGRLEAEQRGVDERLKGGGGKGEGIDIMDWFHFAMFDITSALVFGRAFKNMERGRYHEWVARVFPGMKLVTWSLAVTSVPGLGRVVSWLIPRKVVDEARRHMQAIVDMTDARSRVQLTNPPHQPDFMSHILPPLQLPRGDESMTASLSTEELYLNSQLLCIAGSETTASLLAGAVYFLALRENARHRDRLVAELRDQFATAEDITPASIALRAPFLCAVLNECLRLYPPGAINMPRTVPPGGAMIDGRYVPAGSVVGIAQFAAYRSATHWIDPLKFAPERWLDGEQGKYAGDRKEVFKPFSHGPRSCIGQSLAVAECRLIVARLFWEFDVHVLPGQEDWVRQRTFLSWEKPPLMVHVRKAHRV